MNRGFDIRFFSGFSAFLLTLLIAHSAHAGSCTGKQNGLWCAGSDLVYCSGGNVSWKVWCDAGCKSMPAGTADQCNAGFCSGKQPGLWCKGSDLVNCKSGGISTSKKCSNGCQSMPAGTADQCKAGCSGFCCGKASGLWCDGSKLVDCQNNAVNSSKTCADGCQSMPAGTADKCKAGCTGFCCGKANGLWCDGSKLVDCQNNAVKSSKTCADGCQSMPAGTADKCKPPQNSGFCANKQNGALCEGDALVNCQNGQKASQSLCANGCKSNPPGVADACISGGGSNGGSGNGSLKLCNPFNPSKGVTCKFGCYSGHLGSDYACPDGTKVYSPVQGKVIFVKNSVSGQTCKPDFGNYIKIAQGDYEVFLAHLRKDIQVSVGQSVSAGQHIAFASNSGYTLTSKGGQWVCQQGGGYHLHLEVRKSGKAFDPYASAEVSWTSCDKAAGVGGGEVVPDWCANKQSGKWCKDKQLAHCQDGKLSSIADCAHGCKSNPPGVPDACKPPPGFCNSKADGKHCDGDKLVSCSGGALASEAVCPFGCDTKPAGSDDTCNAPPTWCNNKADGKHCKATFEVACKDGQVAAETPCNNGCGELGAGKGAGCLPVVLDAFCGSKSDGSWCGDGGALVTCIAGKKTGIKACGHGCDGKGPGPDDACVPPPEPTDDCHIKADGTWCKAAALLTCSNGATVQAEACANGCVNAPGTAVCKQVGEPPKDFCDGKVSGLWCNGPTLVTCSNGLTVDAKLCVKGCVSKGDGQPDSCDEPALCEAKVEGAFCDGSRLVQCAAGKEVASEVCVGGCSEPNAGQGVCLDVSVGTDAGTIGIGDTYSGGNDANTGETLDGETSGGAGSLDGQPNTSWLDGGNPQNSTGAGGTAGSSSACSASNAANHPFTTLWLLLCGALLLLRRRARRTAVLSFRRVLEGADPRRSASR